MPWHSRRCRRKRGRLSGFGSPGPAQEDVGSAGASVPRLGWCDGEDPPPQLPLFQPSRNRSLEDPGPARTQSSSRDDEHAAPSGTVGSRDKSGERAMRHGLRHPVQIQSCLDLAKTALEPLGIGAIDPGEAIERCSWRRRDGVRLLELNRTWIRCQNSLGRTRQPAAPQWLYIANRLLPQRAVTPRAGCLARRHHFPTPACLRRAQYGDAGARAHRALCAARYPRCAMDR